MTPAEHRARAEFLVGNNDVISVEKAMVHATLALAPAAPPPRPKPPFNPMQRREVLDVELNTLAVIASPAGALVLSHDATDWSTLLDDPAQVRLLADTLTAHADRMETNR